MSDSDTGQAGDGASVQFGAALSAVKITYEMIHAGAEILEASPFCGTSPTIAEGLAEDVLRSALNVAHDLSQNK